MPWQAYVLGVVGNESGKVGDLFAPDLLFTPQAAPPPAEMGSGGIAADEPQGAGPALTLAEAIVLAAMARALTGRRAQG